MNIPENLLFQKTMNGSVLKVRPIYSITDFAQGELGDVVLLR
jgi:hypothetical protein